MKRSEPAMSAKAEPLKSMPEGAKSAPWAPEPAGGLVSRTLRTCAVLVGACILLAGLLSLVAVLVASRIAQPVAADDGASRLATPTMKSPDGPSHQTGGTVVPSPSPPRLGRQSI